jgi:hypothetical protein
MAMATRWSMEDRILAAVAQEAADIKEECIQAAVKDFEKKVREVVGKVAINVADFYTVERMGTVLSVRIQTGDTNGTSR